MDLRREAVRLRDELQATLARTGEDPLGGFGELTVTVDGHAVFSSARSVACLSPERSSGCSICALITDPAR